MVGIMSLWLPILVSAIFVFVASALIHMFLPYHRSDFTKAPAEDDLMDALRRANIQPGDYVIPHAGSPKESRSSEYIDKMTKGPAAFLTVIKSGPPKMGKELGLWFVYCVIVSIFAAYVAGRALEPGVSYLSVFRFAGVTAFVGYSLALLQDSIWFKRAWSSTFKSMFDGLIYGLLTAGVFGWLWPSM